MSKCCCLLEYIKNISQINKIKSKKKKKKKNFIQCNISLITWKAERNVLLDDKRSGNTNHLFLIQWHCRILATSTILNNAISSAIVTLQKMWIHCLRRGNCSDQGLVPCVYWTRMRTQKQPPSTRVEQTFHSREAFRFCRLSLGSPPPIEMDLK